MPETYWKHIGYLCINKFAFRIDIFEKIFFLARQKVKYGPFLESSELMNPIGCNSNQLKDILMYCGYQNINLSENKKLYFYNLRKETNKKKKKIKKIYNKQIKSKSKIKSDPNSPFAVLEKLL